MNHDSGVAVFCRIAAFAATIVAAGCGYADDCTPIPAMDATIPVAALPGPSGGPSGDLPTDALIDRCQSASRDCRPLCERAIEQQARLPHVVGTCELVTGDAGLAVHVVYTQPCGL